MSSSGTLNESLTQEEKRFYSQIFRTLDPQKSGYISGIAAKPLLEASGLPLPILGEIWNIADPTNVGKLDQLGFCTAMRLIGHAQSGSQVDASLAQKAGALAKFSTIPLTSVGTGSLQANNTGARATSNTSSLSPVPKQSTPQLVIPVLPPQQAKNFAAMFDKEAPTGLLPGDKARDIFLKARLPVPILEKIWMLADQNQAGQLTRPQFIVAMHLIQSFMNKSMSILPTVIPEPIWATASQSSVPATPTSPISHQHSGNSVSSAGATNLNTWIMSSQQKQQYSALFDNLDKAKAGRISGGDVANFLSTSKLPNDVLATIWELANINDDENFNKQEFAIAMYLVQKKLAGFELPEETPKELIQTSSSTIGSPQQVRQSSVQYTPQHPSLHTPTSSTSSVPPPLPPVPGRTAHVPQQSSQLSQKPQTHMDDLLDVFGTSPSASTAPGQGAPAVPAAPTNRSVNAGAPGLTTSLTGGRAFVPSSNFGQHLQQQQQPNEEESSDDEEGPEDLDHKRLAPPAIPGRDQKPSFGSFENTSSTQSVQNAPTGPNYEALRFSNQITGSGNSPSSQVPATTAQPQQPPQTVPAATTREFSSQSVGSSFSNQPTAGGFATQATSGFTDQPTGFSNQPSGFTDFGFETPAGFSNQPTAGFTSQQAASSPVQTNFTGATDREISNKLTQTSVDIANFSNQINSLTNQTTNTNSKRDRAQKELDRTLKVKEKIESKLVQLRNLYEREVQQVKEVEAVLITSKQETDTLNQELSIAEANYHAEQTKLQQLQSGYEESQKKNQVIKEKLGVLNAESIDLKEQVEELTSKTKQIQNMVIVAERQVASQEAENNQLKSKVLEVTNAIREVQAKHSSLVRRADQLEDQQLDLHEQHGQLSADYAEKNLDYSTALSSGAYVAGGAALGAGAAALGAAVLSRSSNESEEIPTATLDDFDDDDFGTTPVATQNKEVLMSPSESASAFDSSIKSSGETEPTQTTDSPYIQQQEQQAQQFQLPFGIPHSETSSIQNNPSQSVRGDLDVTESPTSTIEEERRAPPTILSSQILPEGGQELTPMLTTSQHGSAPSAVPAYDQAESFELVDHEEAQGSYTYPAAEAASTVTANTASASSEYTVPEQSEQLTEERKAHDWRSVATTGTSPAIPQQNCNAFEVPYTFQASDDEEDEVEDKSPVSKVSDDVTTATGTATGPLSSIKHEPSTHLTIPDSLASEPPSGNTNSSIVSTPEEFLDRGLETAVPASTLTERKIDSGLEEEDFVQPETSKTVAAQKDLSEESVADKLEVPKHIVEDDELIETETIGSASPVPVQPSSVNHDVFTKDELASTTKDEEARFPSVDDLSIVAAESEKRVSKTPGAFPTNIDEEFPPLQELEPADEDDSTEDEEVFHDTVQTPAKSGSFEKQISNPPSVPAYPAEYEQQFTSAQAPTQTLSNNPFSAAGLQTAQVETSNSANLFDDLGLEDAKPEDSFDNAFDFNNNGFSDTGFSFAQTGPQTNEKSTTAPAASASDDWEQVFAGFGNDPNLQPAMQVRDEDGLNFGGASPAPPAYDFTSTPTTPAANVQSFSDAAAKVTKKSSISSGSGSGYSQGQQLAIQELKGMGFGESDVLDALKKNNWQLDLATNYLLDSA